MLPNEFRNRGEQDAALACETTSSQLLRHRFEREGIVRPGCGRPAVWGCLGLSRTCDKRWGGVAVEDMGQRRPTLLSWLFQHVCPDAGLNAACPAEEEGEPRRFIGFLLHTHSVISVWHERGDAGRH